MKQLELTIGFIVNLESGKLDDLASLLAEDFLFCGPVFRPLNKYAFVHLLGAMRHGIPNWKSHFREVEVDGDFVRMTIEVTGAHLCTLHLPGMLPHPPTGESFHLPPQQLEFFLVNDKIQRIHLEPVHGGWVDGIMEQLGIPFPAVN